MTEVSWLQYAHERFRDRKLNYRMHHTTHSGICFECTSTFEHLDIRIHYEEINFECIPYLNYSRTHRIIRNVYNVFVSAHSQRCNEKERTKLLVLLLYMHPSIPKTREEIDFPNDQINGRIVLSCTPEIGIHIHYLTCSLNELIRRLNRVHVLSVPYIHAYVI